MRARPFAFRIVRIAMSFVIGMAVGFYVSVALLSDVREDRGEERAGLCWAAAGARELDETWSQCTGGRFDRSIVGVSVDYCETLLLAKGGGDSALQRTTELCEKAGFSSCSKDDVLTSWCWEGER